MFVAEKVLLLLVISLTNNRASMTTRQASQNKDTKMYQYTNSHYKDKAVGTPYYFLLWESPYTKYGL